MSPALDLSILIVSFNTRAELGDCLKSLQTHAPRASHEIIVVDNASTDGTVAAIRAGWPGVRLIEAGGNLGFAAANNIGIKAAAGEFVLLLNSDTLVRERSIDVLIERLRDCPDAAAAGPRIVDGQGRPELSFGRMIAPMSEAVQKVIVRLNDQGVGIAARRVERMTRTRRSPDWISGACLMVRRSDAFGTGLLDERYFLYGEDVDFCAALRKNGKRILFEPEAEIVHLRGRARATRPRESELAYRRAHLSFYAKHHPRWFPVLRLYLRLRGKLPES